MQNAFVRVVRSVPDVEHMTPADGGKALAEQFDVMLLLGSRCISAAERQIIRAVVEHRSITSPTTQKHPLVLCADSGLQSVRECIAEGFPFVTLGAVVDAVCGDLDSVSAADLAVLHAADTGAKSSAFFCVTHLFLNRDGGSGAATAEGDGPSDDDGAVYAAVDAVLQRVDSPTTGAGASPPVVIKVACQDTTDFTKVCLLIQWLEHRARHRSSHCRTVGNDSREISRPRFGRVLVIGGLGGRMDHELSVLNTLCEFSRSTAPTPPPTTVPDPKDACSPQHHAPLQLVLFNGDNTIFVVGPKGRACFERDAAVDLPTCGVVVLGAPTSSIVTHGLQWNLGPATSGSLVFGFGRMQSTSNKIIGIDTIPKTGVECADAAVMEAVTCIRMAGAQEGGGRAVDPARSLLVDMQHCAEETFGLVTIARRQPQDGPELSFFC